MALAKPSPIRIYSIKTVTEGQRARGIQWLEVSWRSYLDRGVIRRGLREGGYIGLAVWHGGERTAITHVQPSLKMGLEQGSRQ